MRALGVEGVWLWGFRFLGFRLSVCFGVGLLRLDAVLSIGRLVQGLFFWEGGFR